MPSHDVCNALHTCAVEYSSQTPPIQFEGRQAEPPSRATETVFIVEDHAYTRDALAGLLTFAGWRVQAFETAREFLAHHRPRNPSCLVLGVCLPDLSGLELQDRLRPDRQALPIIFVTGHSDIRTAVRAMKAGALEFLTRPIDDSAALLRAIDLAVERSREALAGEAELETLKRNYERLSARERQVMTLIVKGLMNKHVSADLGISEITVKAHRGRVMRKMKAASFASLVTMGSTLGLTDTPMDSGLTQPWVPAP